MRITCPNCQATYEVGESDIPEDGIEVECSACLNRWMQMPKSEEIAPEPEPESPPVEPSVEPAQPEMEDESAGAEPEISTEPESPEPEGVEDVFDGAPTAENEERIAEVAPILRETTDAPDEPDLEAFSDDIGKEIRREDAPSSAGWRVPRPPERDPEAVDPLDEILAATEADKKAATPVTSDEEDSDEEAGVALEKEELIEADTIEEEAIEVDSEPEGEEVKETEPVSAPSKPEIEPEAEAEPESELGQELEADSPVSLEADEGLPDPDVLSEPSTPEATENTESQEENPDEAEPEVEIAEIADIEDEDELSDEVAQIEEPSGKTEPDAEEAIPETPPVEDVVPVEAPHWSEAVHASKPEIVQEEAPLAEDAQKGMENLIRDLSEGASTTPAQPEVEMAEIPLEESEPEEDIVHPWSGEVAPTIEDEAPEAPADEDDEAPEDEIAPSEIVGATEDEDTESAEDDAAGHEFEWEEVSEPEHDEALEFDPEPEEDSIESEHIAAIAAQNSGELHPANPQVSNVIQAVIPQAPNATISSRPPQTSRPKPGKPTPVESAEDIEAAIRAQMSSIEKPKDKPEDNADKVKSGLFGKIGRTKKAPEPEAEPSKEEIQPSKNPLKDALLEANEKERAPRSGKRTGFYLVIFVFLTLLAVYLFGDQFSAWVPAVAPYIETYSNLVDSLRAVTQRLLDSVLGG